MIYEICEIEWEDDETGMPASGEGLYSEITVEIPDDMICHSDFAVVDTYLATMLECDTGYVPVDFAWEPITVLPEGAVEWMAKSAASLEEHGFAVNVR